MTEAWSDGCRNVARSMAKCWLESGRNMAGSWPEHGRAMLGAWLDGDRSMAGRWPMLVGACGRRVAGALRLAGALSEGGGSTAGGWPEHLGRVAGAWSMIGKWWEQGRMVAGACLERCRTLMGGRSVARGAYSKVVLCNGISCTMK